jgi:hypothetical protein
MNNVVNVLVVIDTGTLINDYREQARSQDPNNPTGIAHKYSFMVATSNSVISGQAGGDLNISASVGDVIRWAGQSESNDFDSTVIVYNISKYQQDQVTSQPQFSSYTKDIMQPSQSDKAFPVANAPQKFNFLSANIISEGTEKYEVYFALYYRPNNRGQELFGYFKWDPAITVSF